MKRPYNTRSQPKDNDYEDKPNVVQKSYNKKEPAVENEWLSERSERIWDLNSKNNKPAQIASTLNSEAKLKQKSGVTGKQVSDWMRYRKKAGKHKTNPVSLDNNNLRVENTDGINDLVYYLFNNE